MPYFIISILALGLALAVMGLAWQGPEDPQVLLQWQRLRAWQAAQSFRLRALGAGPTSQMLWRAPLVGLVSGLLLAWLLDSGLFIVIGLAAGLAWPGVLESRLRAKRLVRLGEQVPALFEALASALRSGQSLPQAVASAGEDLPLPASELLAEALRRIRLGEEAELALEAAGVVLEQGPLRADWRMLCTAVAVVRGSGGKLPEILDQLAVTVRERQRLQAQVRAQTAQAQLSAWVIGCLPPALLLAMQILDPELTAPLFHTVVGWVLLAAALGLELAGVFLMRRLSEVTA